MNARTPAPPGLKWLAGPVGRTMAMGLALLALGLSIYVGVRYNQLVDCLKSNDAANRVRTAALAPFTDAERAAETARLTPGGDPKIELENALAARQATDAARRKYPPPPATACGG